ncbi:hypothetical protein I350_06094 [Cryptococcus amylolentus CBS 6273]|uniref:Uncharacterized protein n=1 Tax=Cryptococcus amylolentus CBS 6273 TaxID=1296118 RepID=A0A1E3JQU0_9TREE|nr:hypothetical protein I350_06094 [Cryptococcus amylolentus CBS 6273]
MYISLDAKTEPHPDSVPANPRPPAALPAAKSDDDNTSTRPPWKYRPDEVNHMWDVEELSKDLGEFMLLKYGPAKRDEEGNDVSGWFYPPEHGWIRWVGDKLNSEPMLCGGGEKKIHVYGFRFENRVLSREAFIKAYMCCLQMQVFLEDINDAVECDDVELKAEEEQEFEPSRDFLAVCNMFHQLHCSLGDWEEAGSLPSQWTKPAPGLRIKYRRDLEKLVDFDSPKWQSFWDDNDPFSYPAPEKIRPTFMFAVEQCLGMMQEGFSVRLWRLGLYYPRNELLLKVEKRSGEERLVLDAKKELKVQKAEGERESVRAWLASREYLWIKVERFFTVVSCAVFLTIVL